MADLRPVFAELAAIMRPYAAKLEVKVDTDTNLYIDTRYVQKNRKPLFFGAVQLKKNYVSFHLMPLYVRPALVDGIPPELRKRMQGKACFNFSGIDKPRFKELGALTKAGYASYKEQGFV